MSSRKETKLLVENFRLFLKEAPKKPKENPDQMGLDFTAKPKAAAKVEPPPAEPEAEASNDKLVLLDLDGTLWDKRPNMAGAPVVPNANFFMKSTKQSLENGVKGGPFAGDGNVFSGTVERVKQLKSQGYRIIILTARKYVDFDKYRTYPNEGKFIEWMDKNGLTLISDASAMEEAVRELVRSIGVPFNEIYPVNSTTSKPEIYKRRAIDDLLKTKYPGVKEVVIIDDELADTMERRAKEANPAVQVQKIKPS